jgi:hypothetical protein
MMSVSIHADRVCRVQQIPSITIPFLSVLPGRCAVMTDNHKTPLEINTTAG